MKKAVYKIFKASVYNRAMGLKTKQLARVERLRRVMADLNEWDDIPISFQFTSLCSMLKIKPDHAAKHFINGLCIGQMYIETEARKLPLI